MNSIKIVKKRGNYDLYLTFFSKKVEKTVSATYLITEHFSQEESLKWQLREKGLQLLSDTMSLNKMVLPSKDKILSDIRGTILEIISFLDVSLIAKVITEMNVEILKRELNLLLNFVDNNLMEKIGQENFSPLKKDFFKVKGNDLLSRTTFNKKEILNKGQNKGQNISKSSFTVGTSIKTKGQGLAISVKRQSRKEQILKLFNKGQKLMIKDISQVINNCGEKTIQRELQAMMKAGSIKKEGKGDGVNIH